MFPSPQQPMICAAMGPTVVYGATVPNTSTNLTHRHTHTRLTALCPGLPGWAGTRKVKPIWILLKQDSEWQWHQLDRMQVCNSLQTDNHASTPPLSFLQARCPSCRPTNSIRALKALVLTSLPVNLHEGFAGALPSSFSDAPVKYFSASSTISVWSTAATNKYIRDCTTVPELWLLHQQNPPGLKHTQLLLTMN